jgi:hypothetical protein
MVNKRSMGGMVGALSLFLVFPALASAHTLSVSVGPSQCVTPLNGQYSATVTITERYFSGTIENIPAGQNVYQLSSSTDKGNTGLNQNYFTRGAVGTQTGPVSLGQPTSFTSPASGATATLQFTVTTSVPETYVLSNSYMHSPATGAVTAPASGCTPPPSCPSGETLVNGVCVPPTSCPTGQTLVGGVCVPPTSCPSGQVLTGGECQPPASCPTGQVLTGGQCQPPSSCPTGTTMTGGQCQPPTSCPTGTTMTGSVCTKPTVQLPPATVYPGVCRASTKGFKVRAGQEDTIIVSVHRHGAAVAGAVVRITLPGGQVVSRTTGTSGKATFRVAPTQSGTILVRSKSCKEMVTVKVYAAKATTVTRAPSFTG